MTVGQLIDYRAVNFLDWVEGVLPNKIIILELDNKDVLSSTRYRRHPVSYTHLTLPTICSV